MKTDLKLLLITAVLAVASACSKPAPETTADKRPTAALPEQPSSVTMSLKTQKDSGVETAPLKMQAVAEVVHSTARLTNDEDHTWRVGAITEGRIVSVEANVGDLVKKDQILARMHSHDIHESRAENQKAIANLARAKGAAEYAARVRDRAKRLYDLKAGSLEQLERAETELRNAQTDVQNAETDLARTKNHLTEFLGVDLEDPDAGKPKGSDDTDLIPVRAPASGIVLTRNVTPGTVVTSSTDQFLISDLSKLWAIVEVREEFLGRLRLGMPARIYVQAYGTEAFHARISKIGDVLDPATRTVKVRVELDNSQKRLKPEMYATSEIDLGTGETAFMVPAEAVQEIRGQQSVFIQTAEDRFEIRTVKAGRTMENLIEISGNLKPGDRVCVHSAFVLKSEFLKGSMKGNDE
jgi:membrane fusion protein, heavy metal efflux system